VTHLICSCTWVQLHMHDNHEGACGSASIHCYGGEMSICLLSWETSKQAIVFGIMATVYEVYSVCQFVNQAAGSIAPIPFQLTERIL
jgi:hypothetical protein